MEVLRKEQIQFDRCIRAAYQYEYTSKVYIHEDACEVYIAYV